ncbi:ribosome biogenesis GTPase Der [Caldanaerobius polysaccharolyticus]|uniref:ribosome biogenesis GTPase Der n=1 Tax=Caldanaerobius polysaccharolyticus TaxID=44256 RepID=UPI00047DEFF9|nr:ribosome biogenesis GTPase Der [Caldanaerobius polysaccharolyticus]
MPGSIVAIVGRPNVGKSTLFNRLAGKRIAIIEDKPGVTRDRLYHTCEWAGKVFTIVDTGGIDVGSTDTLFQQIRKQAQIAIDTADVVVFVVDAKEGLLPADWQIADILRKSNKPVIVACNKVDSAKMRESSYEFYGLGFDHVHMISSVNGTGTGDLLDTIVKLLPDSHHEEYDEDTVKVAVIGRPNAGKSSIINKVLGEERVIVSDIPGTTRDAIDTPFEIDGKKYVFIDTAGIRRKSKIEESVEYYSVLRAMSAIDRSDVCLMVIDSYEGIVEQDTKIAGYAHEQGKGMIILMNKWDKVEKDTRTAIEYTKIIRNRLDFISYAPILFVSAKTGQRIPRIIETIDEVAAERSKRLATGVLNDMLNEVLATNPLPSAGGKHVKLYYGTQVAVKPPTFVFFSNYPEEVHFSYVRFLENHIRKLFGFEGTPIRIKIKKRGEV